MNTENHGNWIGLYPMAVLIVLRRLLGGEAEFPAEFIIEDITLFLIIGSAFVSSAYRAAIFHLAISMCSFLLGCLIWHFGQHSSQEIHTMATIALVAIIGISSLASFVTRVKKIKKEIQLTL